MKGLVGLAFLSPWDVSLKHLGQMGPVMVPSSEWTQWSWERLEQSGQKQERLESLGADRSRGPETPELSPQ